ncbi:MAG: hypothetical protein RL033_296 [Pseudomonadota bacterium]|jgi:uncharacterized damage-inducible protein DinB
MALQVTAIQAIALRANAYRTCQGGSGGGTVARTPRLVNTELDGEVLEFARGLGADRLNSPLTWTSQLCGFTQTSPRFALVLQMFNHPTHHRGQVHAVLTRQGVDPRTARFPL